MALWSLFQACVVASCRARLSWGRHQLVARYMSEGKRMKPKRKGSGENCVGDEAGMRHRERATAAVEEMFEGLKGAVLYD